MKGKVLILSLVVLLVACAPAATPMPTLFGSRLSERWIYGYEIEVSLLVDIDNELHPEVEVYALRDSYSFEDVPETIKTWDEGYKVSQVSEPGLPIPDLVVDGFPLTSFERRWFKVEYEGQPTKIILVISHNVSITYRSVFYFPEEKVHGEAIITNEALTDVELLAKFVPNFRGGIDDIKKIPHGFRVLISW